MPHQCAHWFAMTCRRQKGVCGCKDVARNDMQKEGRVRECKDVGRVRCAEGRACQRVQGPPPCHCEERSDVAIRISCGSTKQRAAPKANTGKCIRICPK